MIAFARRQRILRILQEQPGIRVSTLAKTLHVTEATVRTDLSILESELKVQRVRGGALLLEPPPAENGTRPLPAADGDLRQEARLDSGAARFIGRWAADIVEDDDTILLDASALAFSMAPYLSEHKRLTIVTNSLEVAQFLARNPGQTIILMGGVLRSDGLATGGVLGATTLAELHIRLAFVSGAGFSPEMGLMDDDLQDAQLKRLMLDAASYVIALVDSTRIGRKGLTVVAPPERIHHLFADTGIAADQLEQLRQLPCDLTVCGENTVSNYTSHRTQQIFKIGFANLSEEIPFAVDVRRGLEKAAKQRSNVDLVFADNRLSGERALEIADNFIAKGVQLAIEYQIDARMGTLIMNKYQRARVPVIAVDIPMVGATYFGVDNFYSGQLAGKALGQWILKHWSGEFDRLLSLEEPRAGALPEARMQGQLRGLEDVLGKSLEARLTVLNSGNTSAASALEVQRTLAEMPDAHRIAVISFNDDAAVGALKAARLLQREDDLAIVGQGADRMVRQELRQPGTRIIGSTAFMPERYGEKLIDLSLRLLHGESVPPAVYMDHVFVDAGNVDALYPAA